MDVSGGTGGEDCGAIRRYYEGLSYLARLHKIAYLEEIAASVTDYGKLNHLIAEKEETEQKLEEKIERWMYLDDPEKKPRLIMDKYHFLEIIRKTACILLDFSIINCYNPCQALRAMGLCRSAGSFCPDYGNLIIMKSMCRRNIICLMLMKFMQK